MSPTSLRWDCPHYSDITRDDLYAVLQLRQIVFIVEQNCVFLDADGHDDDAWHLMGWIDGTDGRMLIAYARLYAPGVKYEEAAIGRVITHPENRGRGIGILLMREALSRVSKLFGETAIRISAQLHLERFYNRLGFTRVGEPFIEDEIPHIRMLRVSDQPGTQTSAVEE